MCIGLQDRSMIRRMRTVERRRNEDGGEAVTEVTREERRDFGERNQIEIKSNAVQCSASQWLAGFVFC